MSGQDDKALTFDETMTIVINDGQELMNYIDEVQHRVVDCDNFVAVKSRIVISGHEFTTTDKVNKPAVEIARSIARNQTELLELIVGKIREGELDEVHKRTIKLSDELQNEEE
jgi:hypothetical protein